MHEQAHRDGHPNPYIGEYELPRERLNGVLPANAAGHLVEPGDALPYDPSQAPPTMLMPRELSYLHWLGSQTTGSGRVVELGCFLGGSTAALADGRCLSMGSGPYVDAPMLVYDSFEAPGSPEVESWWMRPYGLKAGEDFLPKFREAHAKRWGSLDVRKRWLPGGLESDALDLIYPEQQPIELLFVDAAKTWETHVTILRAFVSRMTPGSILVQQDFMDLLPWITVHMWELRDCFEPLDLVLGAPTLSFRCVADPTTALASLIPDREAFRQCEHQQVWEEIESYWTNVAPNVFEGVLASHACLLALQARQHEEALIHAERYTAWAASSASHHVYRSAFWDGWLERLERTTAAAGEPVEAVRNLRVCLAARRMMPARDNEHAGTLYLSSRYDAWRRAASALREVGASKIALFGGGQHTRWILGPEGPLARSEAAFEVVCVIDDSPSVGRIEGVPVLRPDQLDEHIELIDAIVPSSDAYERRILQRIHDIFSNTAQTVVPLYTNPSTIAEPRSITPPPTPPRRPNAHDLASLASHRISLGLEHARPWLDAFAESYVVPEWATGYVNHNDSLMLWDLMEAVRPSLAIEIGVAAGVSTLMLASAMEALGIQQGRLISVDLAERCYFDERHPVGAALAVATARVQDRVEVLPGRSAIDACCHVPCASVDLAFIDGDHRHPAPTLDLIALLPALAPGAWVALHDIELPEIARAYRQEFAGTTGAAKLFHAWPFERVQPDHKNPALNNIGAIRIPDDSRNARRVLVELLREPWEIGSPSDGLQRVLDASPTVSVRSVATERAPTSG